jgi:hypothetical protein
LPADLPEQVLVVHATTREQVVFESASATGKRMIETMTPAGERLDSYEQSFKKGLTILAMPPGGYAFCRKLKSKEPRADSESHEYGK